MTWYTIEYLGKNRYRLVVKWWDPRFWREGYRTLRESGTGRLESLYLTLVLIWTVMCK